MHHVLPAPLLLPAAPSHSVWQESRKAAEANVAQMILMLLGERSRADVLRRLRINFLLDVETGSDQEFAKRAAHIFVVAQGTVAAGQPLEGSMRVAKYASSPSTGGLPLHPRMGESQTHHYVRSANRLVPPFPSGLQSCVFAAGCFWGTEKGFWRLPGVYSTAVGYVDGTVAQPTYKQVCSGRTGHTEATLVVWDPSQISLADLLRRFFDCHDPVRAVHDAMRPAYRVLHVLRPSRERRCVGGSRHDTRKRAAHARTPTLSVAPLHRLRHRARTPRVSTLTVYRTACCPHRVLPAPRAARTVCCPHLRPKAMRRATTSAPSIGAASTPRTTSRRRSPGRA